MDKKRTKFFANQKCFKWVEARRNWSFHSNSTHAIHMAKTSLKFCYGKLKQMLKITKQTNILGIWREQTNNFVRCQQQNENGEQNVCLKIELIEWLWSPTAISTNQIWKCYMTGHRPNFSTFNFVNCSRKIAQLRKSIIQPGKQVNECRFKGITTTCITIITFKVMWKKNA